ncbi:ubiquitin-associated protein 2 isoform X2 [Nannospalax galili]|uniref:Ubiquitin-associated protein 2 n=1 Tax=Nannospalax galili TaxID=1026970 RepID=A0A8C6QG64_NANGA|nr:ubiquitin-associated protein 2 isoform X2 [Nannospalax galili]XP_029423812.1 ubiquitin-associated protein 2 isoform X2 [Nannospalax galili]XP_029423813.1 ubiquitin-associated protein 2 isoform X2 [Nannospalax galili]
MMTSVSNDRCRGAREKPQIPTIHATQAQKQVVQATAEQMRLAQVIFDKNDSDFEAKVKQLMEVTGKNQDECIVALHDCNGDVNKAINILLEGNSDTTSWETVGGKKKNFGKESSENKENREKRSEREAVRGRGNNHRKGRGGSRGREFKGEENGIDCNQGDKPSDRGKRARGRGFGRGRGRGTGRFSSQSMGTFNPADYSESTSTDGCGTKLVVWEAAQNGTDEGPESTTRSHNISQDLLNKNSYGLKGAWKNSVEEWTTEDWTEDLSETKVFTASSAPAENHITPGQSIDLVALLQKPVPPNQASEIRSFETSQQQGFGQALVFTNSQHNNQIVPGTGSSTSANSYSPQSLSSVLGSGFGELAPSKMVNISSSQILEKLKAPGLSQFTTTSSSQQNSTSPPATTDSWDLKPTASQSSVLNHFDFKSQPEPSPVLSQLSQRQQHQTQAVSAAPGLEPFPSQAKHRESAPVDGPTTVKKLLQLPNIAVENIVSAHQPQPKHIKLPKRRIPQASKIPASAVEMPGSADVIGLNVQFGALEFGSEPSLSEFGSTSASENSNQIPISLYPKSLSEPLNTSLPMTSAVQNSTYTTSVVTSSSLTSSSLSSNSPVTTSSSYDQSSLHTRVAYQSSVSSPDSAPGTVPNGHGGGRSQHTLDTASSVPAPKTADPPSALPSVGSLTSTTCCTVLLPSVSQHTATLPSLSQPGDLTSSSLSQLSSSLSSHQNSLSSAHAARSSSTPHTHAPVESTSSSTTFSTAASSAPSVPSSGVILPGSMSTVSNLCLGGTTVSVPSNSTRATPLVTSGKAPPNLPQGVPPLLHNQYLVGPGGLLPAYPIYGYDELQMLQSRLPVDYYGIPFAAPTALASRDGTLANNPYSGDITKFGRGDSASPAPPSTPAQAQQSQSQTHHTAQQPFLNPALPPGYSYTGLPYYTGVPSAFQYGPTMFVPPASAKQHGVNLSTPPAPFQQASGYGQHSYSTGYDDLTQGTAAGDYTKGGYGGSSQAPNKSAGSGPGKGVSVSSGTTGLPDMTGSVYNKTQSFDKQGFHAGTPPPFSLPSALGSTGPLAPGPAPGYAPPPFLHILPTHQQPHSQLLHHHLPQDTPSGSGQRSQPSSLQPKSQASKPNYGNAPYWTN